MSDIENLIVTEKINRSNGEISKPVLDGFNISKFREKMLEDETEDTVEHIISNSYQAINSFRDPTNSDVSLFHTPVRILCLGKVQSGKTSFFLGSIALAFDNGYDIACIIGGTKLRLKKQNLGRVVAAFSNNEKIRIFDLNKKFNEDLSELINQGYKIILVVLKNAAKHANLGKLKTLSLNSEKIPTVIIDDEGDEYTPGNQKDKNNDKGKTHDSIGEIIKNYEKCTFLSVTATPQANLLIPTIDVISPDRLVLVQPGKGYTGGNQFFDTKNNPHVVVIEDTDDFNESIPDSFKKALYFFIFSCCLKRAQGDTKPFSMLVHPSSFNEVQNIVTERIERYFRQTILPIANNRTGIESYDFEAEMRSAFSDYCDKNGTPSVNIDQIIAMAFSVIPMVNISVVNYKSGDYDDENEEDAKKTPYKIKIGGNMLGRGLTINRLIVSYIYRDSKDPAVDTMYQRCRWFGYKSKYFDVCRVYLTQQLQQRFIAIVDHENAMWTTMDAFLNTKNNLKQFKRYFVLNDDDLLLTRRSISNTVSVKMLSFGNKPDTSIDLTEDDKAANRKVFDEFLNEYEKKGSIVDFDNSSDHRQGHLLIELPFTTFFNIYLSKVIFATQSPFDSTTFSRIVDAINNKSREDKILVMVMRRNYWEVRQSRDSTNSSIEGLFQGRNDKTQFTGDRVQTDITGKAYLNIPFIQIHLIKLSNDTPDSKAFPLISFNNPYTDVTVRMVTGDNDYDKY